MKLNRKLVLVLALILSVALATGSTLAYLTDRDSEVNVFTVGNVSIELNEKYEQGSMLMPGIDVAKEPTITNTGKNDAWVWATIAIPAALDDSSNASKNVVHFNYSKESVADGLWTWVDANGNWMVQEGVEIEGVVYNVYTVLYTSELKVGQTTAAPMIYKVYLDPHVDVDTNGNMYWVEKGVVTKLDWNVNTFGPTMYVSAYAIQTAGFATVQDAYAAYNEQWGENGAEYAEPGVIVGTHDELTSALSDGGRIFLSDDVNGNVVVPAGSDVEIDLQGNDLNGIIYSYADTTMTVQNGDVTATYIQNNGPATYEDLTVQAGDTANYAFIAGADVTFNDVDLTTAGGGIAVTGGKAVFNSGKVDLNSASTSDRYLFYVVGNGTELTINGGEFTFNKTQNQKRAYIYAGSGATVYVTGGTFDTASTRSGYTAGILGDGTVIITGGTFGFDPTNWVASGYKVVKSGSTWTVTK